MGALRDEVSTRWAARKLKLDVRTIRRWVDEGRLSYVRRELGAPKPDRTSRFVKRFWLSRSEILRIAELE